MKNKQRCEGEERASFSERVCRCLDITPDAFCGESLIEIRGRNYMMIHGGGRILVYTPSEIRVELKKACLRVLGKRLFCASYSSDAVSIEGLIEDISFVSGE